ncbi:MAG: TonB-dependent receptor [Litorilituus sp.]|jgi:hypothetical protein|nr:TonB-dependent receptor [Litorilituus sp.]
MKKKKFNQSMITMAIMLTSSFGISPYVAGKDFNLGSLEVSVLDKKINRQLSGVTILLTDRSNNTSSHQVDKLGKVAIDNLDPGLYSLKAIKDGYITVFESSLRIVANKSTSTKLLMPEARQGIEIISVVGNQTTKSDKGPITTTYMDRESLRSAIGGGSDVLRALDDMPGLTSTGEFASFSVRGRGPQDNLIYVDNMPFDKVVHFDSSLGELEDVGGGGRFSVFAPNLIQGAEFAPGGWGAAYGGKSGSLLKLDVIDGGQTPTASLRIDLAGFEVGYEGPSGFDEDTSIVFNARQLDFGRYFDTIGENDIGDPTLTDILFKSITQIGSDQTIEFLMIHSPEEYSRDLQHVVQAEAGEPLEDNITFRDQESNLIGLTWSSLIGEESEVSTNLYYRTSDKFTSQGESYSDAVPMDTPYQDIPVLRDILTLGEEETEIGFRSDFSTFNQFGELTTGMEVRSFDLTFDTLLREDWQLFTYSQDDSRPEDQKYILLKPENLNSNYDISAVSYAAYIDQAFEFDEWQFNTGLRYEYDDLSKESLVSPRLNVTWSPNSTSQYTFSTGLFYQSPSFLDRASDPQNASLENEEITHISIGGNWRLSEQYNLLAEAYYQKLNNLVVGANRTDGKLGNDGEGDSYGFDTVLTRYFKDDWSAVATYSYNESTRDDKDGLGEFDADYHRPHVFTLGAQWEVSDRWKVGAKYKYLAGQPMDEYVINNNVGFIGNSVLPADAVPRFSQEYITNNTERFGDIHQLNVRVDYFRTFGDYNIIAFLDVVNILGTTVSGEESFDIKTGRLTEDDGDIMPMIGFKVETTF